MASSFLRQRLGALQKDAVLRNSAFIVATSIVNIGAGFLFWILAARSYSPSDVGLAVPLFTAAGVVAAVAGLGFDNLILRFLPNARSRPHLINACLTGATLLAFFVAAGFLGSGHALGIFPFTEDGVVAILFYGASVAALAASLLATSVFIALRRAELAFIQNALAAIIRIPLLAAFSEAWPAFGLVGAWGVSLMLATLLSLWVLLPRAESNYRAQPSFRFGQLQGMFAFSGANHVVTMNTTLVPFVVPLILLAYLPPSQVAYYYVALTLTSPLVVVAQSLSTTSAAEGAHDLSKADSILRRGIRLAYLILIPAVLAISALASPVLRLFGSDYASENAQILRLFAAAGLLGALGLFYFAKLRIHLATKELAVVSIASTVFLLVLTWLFIASTDLGLLGVAVSGVLTQGLLGIWALARWRSRRET